MLKKAPASSDHSPIRALIQRVSLAQGERPARIIAFIAARAREGTSTIAAEYAETLAPETGQKVLLIEAGQQPAKGLRAEAVSQGVADMALAGQKPQNAAQRVSEGVFSARWTSAAASQGAARVLHDPAFWNGLLESFDTIVIDAPPLAQTFDGVALAARADAAVIVVEAEKTPQPVVRRLRETLEGAGANIAGVVMNKRRFYIPNRVYKKL